MTERNEADGDAVEDAGSSRFGSGFDSRRLHSDSAETTREIGLAMPPSRKPAQNLPDRNDPPQLTVAEFAVTWLEERSRTCSDWRKDRSKLRIHILPPIGGMPLAAVKAEHLAAIVRDLRGAERAERTVDSVYWTAHVMFRDAVRAGLIESSPCTLTGAELGRRSAGDGGPRVQKNVAAATADPGRWKLEGGSARFTGLGKKGGRSPAKIDDDDLADAIRELIAARAMLAEAHRMPGGRPRREAMATAIARVALGTRFADDLVLRRGGRCPDVEPDPDPTTRSEP